MTVEIVCPECHSRFFLTAQQAAQAAQFCPFCGFALSPSIVPQESESLAGKPTATEASASIVEGQAPTPESIQFVIGPYQILHPIGKGGMGEVLLAYDTSCGRRIALKRIRTDLKSHALLYNRFLKEARITAQLTHPAIIPIYAIHVEENLIYYTMPYVEGETLKEIFRKTRKQEKEGRKLDHLGGSIPALVRILITICQAIAYAHSKDVLHRDIKSENIIVGKFGEVMILDWGLAKVVKKKLFTGFNLEGEEQDARLEKVVGTVGYMAPERGLGYPATIQSDIYSLGVILYQILTLQLPFKRGDVKEFRKRIPKEKFVDPSDVAPYRDVPRILARICQKCLSPNPNERYGSVEDLIRDLENFIEGRAEWFKIATLDIRKKEHWEFQENVFIAEHSAVTRHAEVDNWVSLMISKASFPGNMMLEAKVNIGEQGHGIGFLLSIPEADERQHLNDGYCLWIGSETHRATKLLRSTVEVMTAPDVYLQLNTWYTVRIEKSDNSLHFYLNDVLQFSYISHIPVEGTHVGLLSRDADFELTDFSVSVGSLNVTVNCLAVPDAFLAHKDYSKALTEYRRIGYSFPGRAEGREGMFRAGVTLLEQARNTPDPQEAHAIYDLALQEFEKLHNTPGAPLEYLGKALVYQTQHDYEEEIKCYALALRRYPLHPLMHILHEQIMYRMHESSRSHRLATYNLILLVAHHLPQIAAASPTQKLFNNLTKHWEPLVFFEDVPENLQTPFLRQLDFQAKLAFWTAYPYLLGELLDELAASPDRNPITAGNLLYALITLGSFPYAETKMQAYLEKIPEEERRHYAQMQEHIHLLVAANQIGPEEPAATLLRHDQHIDKSYMRVALYLMNRALDTHHTALALQLYFHFYSKELSPSEAVEFDCGAIWAYLWDKNWKAAGDLLQRYPIELLSHENSPLHFFYGCWLYAVEGKEIAHIHYTGVLETSYPRTWTLASHYLNGQLGTGSRWFKRAFLWEKRQLFRQLSLFYHCIGDDALSTEMANQARAMTEVYDG